MKSKYSSYSIHDFIVDDSFQEWVKADSPIDEVWSKFALDFPEKKAEFEEAKTFLQNIKFTTEKLTAERKTELWDKIDSQTNTEKAKVRSINPGSTSAAKSSSGSYKRRSFLIAAAAAMAGLFFAWQFFFNATVVSTSFAEVKEVRLPDNSVVYLSAQSKLAYSESDFSKNRTLDLEGEAFFDVEAGSTFRVNAEHGSVVVLGTEFNVKDRTSHFEVQCYEGKVQVEHSFISKPEILTRNQSWLYNATSNTAQRYELDGSSRLAWKNGTFIFRDAPMSEVLDEIGRQYKVKIDYESKSKVDLFTGKFANNNLDAALQLVCWPKKLKYDIQDGLVRVFPESN